MFWDRYNTYSQHIYWYCSICTFLKLDFVSSLSFWVFFTLPTLLLVVPAHTSIKQTLVCGNLLCALWHNQSKPCRHTRTRLHAATHAPVLFRHGDSGTHHLPLRGHNISAIREEELHPKSQHCSEDKNDSNILSVLYLLYTASVRWNFMKK